MSAAELPEPEDVDQGADKWPAHDSVDLTLPDPARLDDSLRRQCIAATKAGGRCPAPAVTGLHRCAVHAGRLDSQAGGNARARRLAEDREQARERRIQAKLGPRAAMAAEFAARGEELRATVGVLLEAAAAGDLNAAKALPALLNQALGMPVAPQDISVSTDNVESLSTAQLQALLGRQAPPSAA